MYLNKFMKIYKLLTTFSLSYVSPFSQAIYFEYFGEMCRRPRSEATKLISDVDKYL